MHIYLFVILCISYKEIDTPLKYSCFYVKIASRGRPSPNCCTTGQRGFSTFIIFPRSGSVKQIHVKLTAYSGRTQPKLPV